MKIQKNKALYINDISGHRILHLSIKKKAFEVMITGEKQEEFRKNSDWIRSRLYDKEDNEKQYDYIKFVNGYGADRPYFICVYEGFTECYMSLAERRYSNDLSVAGIGKYDFIIYCGEIVERGNLNSIKLIEEAKKIREAQVKGTLTISGKSGKKYKVPNL